MVTCRCTSLKHPEHPGRMCENLATEPDRYCEACHAHIAHERESTKTDQLKPPAGGQQR